MNELAEVRRVILENERKQLNILQKLEKYQKDNKTEFFKPLWYQQKIIDYLHSGKKVVLLQGANQIGKTILGANLVASFVMGKQGWDKKPSIFGERKTRGRIICKDWEHHANEVIVPVLKEWLPRGSYETRRNNVGIECFWKFRNGSTIELMTSTQDVGIHEGWAGDWVWADEPFPREKYTANKRGLIASNGIFIMTLTALSEPWILDDIVLSQNPSIGCVTNVDIRENIYLTPEAIENFENSLDKREGEDVVRARGGWFQLTGLILKDFDKDKHIIEPFKIPPDWRVIAMIDIHPKKEQAIGFYTTSPKDIDYVIDEIWKHLSPEQIAYRIIEKKNQNNWRMEEAYIDPLARGDSNYVANVNPYAEDSFNIIRDILMTNGIDLYIASKDKDSGIRNIKEGLKSLNNMPSLFFFNTCERHIYEAQRWTWDNNSPNKEEPKALKVNDDMMENLYRYTLTDREYRPLILERIGKKTNYAYV